jgi:hypothetical protein
MGLSAALVGGSLLAAGGSVASGIIGSNAAQGAAQTQAGASEQAAQLQYQEAQQALAAQEAEYKQSQINEAPWLNTGGSAEQTLGALFGLPQYSTPQVQFPSLTAANPNFSGTIGPTQAAPGTSFNSSPSAAATQASVFNFTPAAPSTGILSGNASPQSVEGLPTGTPMNAQTFQQFMRNNPQVSG